MASAYSSSRSSSQGSNVMWEQGDDYTDYGENSSPSHSEIQSPLSSPPISPISSQATTPGITTPLSTLGISSQSSTFFPESSITQVPKKLGRRKKSFRFHGNQFTSKSSQTTQSQSSIESSPRKRKQPALKLSKRGYCSLFTTPRPSITRDVEFKTPEGSITSKRAGKPTGMRILDIGILAEAMSLLKCSSCSSHLSLFESDFDHGWQTTFSIKCPYCHQLFAEFPSSKPMDVPAQSNHVNVHHPVRAMNEVTMRSVLAVHCSGFSWRDLHKFATIFDMPPPLSQMPTRYLNKIESTVEKASKASMDDAADQLHMKVDAVPSAVDNCINIAVSFDSSWKTRGFYSNIGFGSAISASSKRVLDYVLLNRICEKCNRWNDKRKQANPEAYQQWYDSHKSNCLKNYSGSSQSMEPEAAKIIWNRSIDKHHLCYSTFIGDGDSKSYQQVVSMDPYPLVPIHKEECLAHVSKRLKKSLCRIKKSTKAHSYIQHKVTEPKAEFVSSNFSTVVLQHRGKTPTQMAEGLCILFSHISGEHDTCPIDSWCRWRNTKNTTQPIPATTTNFSTQDVAKVREVFNIFATEDFCRHLTLGMTQNANESLHNTIWNFCPKAKYISPQSIRISTGIAVTVFNDGELSFYGLLSDLKLNPSYTSFRSLCRRENTRKLHLKSTIKKNIDRRTRRQRTMRERRERDLLKSEGGRSYKSCSFGSEVKAKPPMKGSTRTRGRGRGTSGTTRGKGVKRRLTPAEHSSSSSDTDISTSSGSSDGVCDICERRQPPPQKHRTIFGKATVQWVGCDECERWYHQCCTELDEDIDVSTIDYKCFHCSS